MCRKSWSHCKMFMRSLQLFKNKSMWWYTLCWRYLHSRHERDDEMNKDSVFHGHHLTSLLWAQDIISRPAFKKLEELLITNRVDEEDWIWIWIMNFYICLQAILSCKQQISPDSNFCVLSVNVRWSTLVNGELVWLRDVWSIIIIRKQ